MNLPDGTNTIDLAKAAKLAADVAAVAAESDLDGLTVADADSDFLTSAGIQIRTQAEVCSVRESSSILREGMCERVQMMWGVMVQSNRVAELSSHKTSTKFAFHKRGGLCLCYDMQHGAESLYRK